jgi:hypothetical protein
MVVPLLEKVQPVSNVEQTEEKVLIASVKEAILVEGVHLVAPSEIKAFLLLYWLASLCCPVVSNFCRLSRLLYIVIFLAIFRAILNLLHICRIA